jgi:pyridoxal phosphate enzyme (YggS family)
MDAIGSNLQAVRRRIASAAAACGRSPEDVTLVAVSKTFGAGHIAAAYAHGQRAFGESYVQEALAKLPVASQRCAALASPAGSLLRTLEWHFIGPIQSNKTRAIAEHFAWVHSIDRTKIAERLSAARPADQPPLQACIQVNIGGEDTKSGVAAAAALDLARAVAALPRLRLRGLMAIPPVSAGRAEQRRHFASLRQLKERLVEAGIPLDTLSMGMSADLEAAIAEGATVVRVGTAIFGSRDAP